MRNWRAHRRSAEIAWRGDGWFYDKSPRKPTEIQRDARLCNEKLFCSNLVLVLSNRNVTAELSEGEGCLALVSRVAEFRSNSYGSSRHQPTLPGILHRPKTSHSGRRSSVHRLHSDEGR